MGTVNINETRGLMMEVNVTNDIGITYKIERARHNDDLFNVSYEGHIFMGNLPVDAVLGFIKSHIIGND